MQQQVVLEILLNDIFLGMGHAEMQYTTFSDFQVKCLRIVVEHFSPHTCTSDVVY